jgi:hypothetical protein
LAKTYVMARTPFGNTSLEESRTATLAYVAARLSCSSLEEHDDFIRQELGLRFSARSARRAGERRLSHGAPRAQLDPDRWLRNWILVDELALGLRMARVVFPGKGKPRPRLRESLEKLPGVVQVIELKRSHDLETIVVFTDDQERADTSRALSLLGQFSWSEILYETHDPAAMTWARQARNTAKIEGLL